jgi:hypothetical protein
MTLITQSDAHKEAIDKLRAWSKKKARVFINPIIVDILPALKSRDSYS